MIPLTSRLKVDVNARLIVHICGRRFVTKCGGLLRPPQREGTRRHKRLPFPQKACNFGFDCSGGKGKWFAASEGSSDAAWQ